jgi:ABC-type nitrate/sulfonate/bicarbonate transport system substrate-binding protein
MKYHRVCIIAVILLATVINAASRATPARAMAQTPLRIAMSASPQPTNLAGMYGPVHYGNDFGLDITKDSFVYFEAHALAVQSVLSGQADIVGGSFVSEMLVQQAGQDFKAFCVWYGKADYLLVGRSGITRIEQLLDPQVRVSVDSPGGVADMALNMILQAEHINATTKTLANLHILESSAERRAAMQNNVVDVTILNVTAYRQLQADLPNTNVISKLYEVVPAYLAAAYAAPKEWLDTHLDEATAFCAAVIKGQRNLRSDFDLFSQAASEFISKPPSVDTLHEVWGLIGKNDAWSLEKGLDPEAVTAMSNVMVMNGILKAPMNPDDILDLRPSHAAIKLLGSYVSPTEQATPAR